MGTTELLRRHPLFASLAPEASARIAAVSQELEVRAGEVLIGEGDVGDAAYLVISGRLAVTTSSNLVGTAGRGDLIGELALLSDQPRAATVRATRDAVVLRIDGAAFCALAAAEPDVQRHLNGQLVERMRSMLTHLSHHARGTVLAVVTDGSDRADAGVTAIAAALARLGVTVAHVPVTGPRDVAELVSIEDAHDVVLLLPALHEPDAVAIALRHADRGVLVCDGGAVPVGRDELRLPHIAPPIDLVLVHPDATDCPRGTHRWLALVQPEAHHHARSDDRAHHDRVARRLVGRERALVLSGGGARGVAHVGTYRALCEAGHPVDVIAGVSAGAIFAAGIARGWTPARLEDETRALLVRPRTPVDFTAPTVALARGRRINERIQRAFADDDLRLEDLWVPMIALSANLTTADVHVHQRGPVWRAVRASVAIPGVFPPVAEPEGLLVDGGLVDNLPVGRVRALYPAAHVTASDAGRRVELLPDRFPADGELSGWSALRERHRSRGPARMPGIVRLLGRLSALGGAGIPVERGDLHVEHRLDGFGMFDFRKGDAIMVAGYTRTREVLDAATA